MKCAKEEEKEAGIIQTRDGKLEAGGWSTADRREKLKLAFASPLGWISIGPINEVE